MWFENQLKYKRFTLNNQSVLNTTSELAVTIINLLVFLKINLKLLLNGKVNLHIKIGEMFIIN